MLSAVKISDARGEWVFLKDVDERRGRRYVIFCWVKFEMRWQWVRSRYKFSLEEAVQWPCLKKTLLKRRRRYSFYFEKKRILQSNQVKSEKRRRRPWGPQACCSALNLKWRVFFKEIDGYWICERCSVKYTKNITSALKF